MYTVRLTTRARKQIRKLHKNAMLFSKFKEVLADITQDPYSLRFKSERLRHTVDPTYSKRISKKDRVVYVVEEKIVTVTIVSVIGHYDDK